ncbi:PHD finger containing protein Phf1 [Diplocarpon rosae]|nr:PHD finger containing protein Phf1 [Diplocarpon rosae]
MTSNDPTRPPATPGSSTNIVTDSTPKYVQQFSAATEMILKRINSGATSSLSSIGITGTPAGYEDMRRSVLQGMKTSMSMELPPIANPGGRQKPFQTGTAKERIPIPRKTGSGRKPKSATPSTTPGGSASGGKAKTTPKARTVGKRKRQEESESSEEESDNMSKLGGDSDSEEEEDSIPELPKITQSGRQVNKPAQFVPAAYGTSTKKRAPSRRSQEQALCKKCQRGHSPQNNMIVFCDGCNLGWHQQCHEPQVAEEAVKDEDSPWFCAECSRKKGIKSGYETIPGVSWQGRSSEEKRAYLNSLPHPQLVTLLLQASVLHPNLPIFPPTPSGQLVQAQAYVPAPAPRQTASQVSRTNTHVQQPFPPSAASTAGLFKRAEGNPNAPINFIRKIQPGQPGWAPTTPTPPPQPPVHETSFAHASSAPPQLAAQAPEPVAEPESRESTPASPPYPKAGNGLMAKLGPDEEDLDWLVDASDFDTFSHAVYNDRGEKTEENGVAVNSSLLA